MAEHVEPFDLLAELEGLRQLFSAATGSELPAPPPAPPFAAAPGSGLLDLTAIFDDDWMPPPETAAVADAIAATSPPDREALVDALLTRLLPQLENSLREQLGQLEPEVLQRWLGESG